MLEQKCTILNTGAVAFYFKLNTMTTNGSRIREGCEALALSGRAALLYTMLPPVLLSNYNNK